MDADANANAGGSTIALRECCSGELKNRMANSKDSDETAGAKVSVLVYRAEKIID